MSKKLSLLIFFVILFVNSFAAPPVDYGPKYLSPGDEFVTPHIKWLKPYAGGPIKALFIINRLGMREIVELAQRMDLDYQVFAYYEGTTVERSTLTANPGRWEADFSEKIKDDYDLIIMGNIDWSQLLPSIRGRILEKVKEGTPLLGYLRTPDECLKIATEEKMIPSIPFLFPYKALPAFAGYADFDSFFNSTAEISKFGKGKIILLKKGYEIPARPHFIQAFTPRPRGTPFETKIVEYDYYLAYLIRLILFASNKEPEVTIEGKNHVRVERGKVSVIAFDLNVKKKVKLSAFFIVRDEDNHIVRSEEKMLSILGSQNVSFEFPKLTRGNYFADLWLKEGEKVVNFGSSFLEITSADFIGKVDIKKSYQKEEPISGKITVVTGEETGDLKLQISQRDNFNRITNRKIIFLDKNEKELSFSLKPATPLSIIQYLDVELLKGKEILDKKGVIFSISNLYPKDDIRYIIWAEFPRASYLYYHLAEAIYQAGFDTCYLPYGYGADEDDYWEEQLFSDVVWLANLYQLPRAHIATSRPKVDGHYRMPCLNDPEYREDVTIKLIQTTAKPSNFSTLEYSSGNEVCFVYGNPEVCFCSNCVSRFHQFLEKEYGNLEQLNTEYESNYTSFSQVKPVTLEEVKKDARLVPQWVDFRRCMEDVWAGFHQFARETVQRIVPQAKYGYDGSDTTIKSARAADFFKLGQAMNLNNSYFRPFKNHMAPDFARPGTLLGLAWYGGYNPHRNEPFNRHISWQYLFRGANSFWVWWSRPGAQGSVVAPDFSFYDFFKTNIKEMEEIKSGTGKLLISSKRDNNKIAVLYSASSVHSAALSPSFPDMNNVLNSLATLLEDTTSGFQFISYKQLEEGILNNQDFQLLILPFCQSISEKEAMEISSFVEQGGTVLADLRPAVSDGHGKPYGKGVLDEIFGINQNTKCPEAKKGAVILKNFMDMDMGRLSACTDASLKLNSAKAKTEIEGTPAFVVNNYGSGRTVLLNFSLSEYVTKASLQLWQVGDWEVGEAETAPDNILLKNFFKTLLRFAGIKEEAELVPDIPGLRKYSFTAGSLKYLGLLQKLPEPEINYAQGKAKSLASSSTTVFLSGKNHIYDIRKGKYLGYSDKIKAEIEPGRAELYGLLPYEVKCLKIIVPNHVCQGDDLEYAANIMAEGGDPQSHVFRLSLISPEGKEMKYYSDNLVAEKGMVKGSVPLSLNEITGKWKLRIKDVVSGTKAEETFVVEEKND